MHQAESMPEHDILVIDAAFRIGLYPCGKALRRLAGTLGDVAAGGVDLGVVV